MGRPNDAVRSVTFFVVVLALVSGPPAAGQAPSDEPRPESPEPVDSSAVLAQEESACVGGHADACLSAFVRLAYGDGVEVDMERALRNASLACDHGLGMGCAAAGAGYVSGLGVPVDRERGIPMLRRGCELGVDTACEFVAQIDSPNTAPLDSAGIAEACASGDEQACMRAGAIVLDQDSSPLVTTQARDGLERGCAAQVGGACYLAAIVYYSGLGVARDPAAAARFAGEACDLGNLEGCTVLAICLFDGTGIEPDQIRAVGLFERACRGGVPQACDEFAQYMELVERGPDPAAFRPTAELEADCEADDLGACAELGIAYVEGAHVERDYEHARALFTRACDGNALIGCMLLASLYANGWGVARDLDRVETLLERACDGGIERACTRLAEVRRTR